ncbi:hypothetical protein F0562_006853 [Nyssa sinensis]|uniref:FYVE-type domain-containing protein n=1 Tax=Nyssa sinensis TaxID=561372 RepID=A0A5J5ALP3_9ASTE|nr:hypothetical protein F0562_006853 [Nyssa sinensis]
MTSYSSASNGHPGASTVPNYKNPYESGLNFGSYGAQGMYGDIGEPRAEIGSRYDHGRLPDDVSGGGAYRYNGGNTEPYGARRCGSKGSTGVIFDDYGRPVGFTNGKEDNVTGSLGKIVKAIPKTGMQQDTMSGVQKFRVKLLSEAGGQSDMDVLCQIGLDGIQILDPATCRTLRIYPLETVTRWEVLDSHIFAFWAKSSIDIEPRRIRLESNSYTTNNILDTVTAATIQLKEIGARSKPSDSLNVSEQPSEKKKGFADWMKIKPVDEEKYHWVPDEAVTKCTDCGSDFGAFVRKHHCRNCGDIFCDKCTQGRIALTADEHAQPVRVCDQCLAELQEEMDKNFKISTGLKSDRSGMQMKEVACPTCTVHLQVQVPVSGSETVECSVCQHPFLVSAH